MDYSAPSKSEIIEWSLVAAAIVLSCVAFFKVIL